MQRGRTFQKILFVLIAAAALHATPVQAQDYTDIWYKPDESGWGVNVVQSDNFLFVTFFIYGPDRRPTWYTANLTWNGSVYTGPLYLTNGSWFAAQWNPAELTQTAVGTATFQPSNLNAYQATLTYTVSGTGTVVKAIQRQTLTEIALGGNYVGGQSGTYANCPNPADNGPYIDTYTLVVGQTSARLATLAFTYDSDASCTLSGQLQQFGQLHRIAPATYQCTGSLTVNTTATVFELKQTSQGIEGRFVATLANGCQETAAFSAVLR